MRKRLLAGLSFVFFLGVASPLRAQSNPVQYVYDAQGRLTQVIDPSGNTATYNYDAVGNLLSITRSTTSPSGLAVFSFSPAQGSVGQTVTIQGQNFSVTPSANTVKFNGTTATVTAATTQEGQMTVSGLVITRNAADGPEVTHFKISQIKNGTLQQNDGVTVIPDGGACCAAAVWPKVQASNNAMSVGMRKRIGRKSPYGKGRAPISLHREAVQGM